jgi:lipopolysaccharide export system permease protein
MCDGTDTSLKRERRTRSTLEVFLFGTIINRLIFMELTKVFLLSLTALTGLFMLAGLISEAAQHGLAPNQILAVIPLLIPNTLPYTIPSTTLFATCVVYGRMAHDNEVLVLKSAGVNILHLLKPAVFLGLLTTSTTMFLYYDTIPRTQRLLRAKILSDAEDVIYSLLKREGCMRQPGMNYTMYVREVQGKRLLDVIFKRRAPHGQGHGRAYDLVARAREAHLHVDLANMQLIVDMGRCVVFGEKDGVGGDVQDRRFEIPLPDSLFGRDYKNRPSAMTWEEVRERLIELREGVRNAESHLADVESRVPSPSADSAQQDQYQAKLKEARYLVEHWNRGLRHAEAELQMRPALSFGCLCFVLIGCPVGIWASRSDYLSTFVICFLPTVFIYYPLLLAGGNLAKDGKVPMDLGIWSADIILGACSLALIWKLMRR